MVNETKISYIYGLSSSENSELIRYIGKSDTPLYRLSKHINESKQRKYYRHHWINSEIKKGNNIICTIIGCFDYKDIFTKEKEIILLYKSCGANLVNGNNGGLGGHSPSLEIRARMSKSKLGNKWNIGKKMSKEHNEKLQLVRRKNKLSAETKIKMFEIRKNNNFLHTKRKITNEEFNNILNDYNKGVKPNQLSLKYDHPIRRIYNVLYTNRIYKDLR